MLPNEMHGHYSCVLAATAHVVSATAWVTSDLTIPMALELYNKKRNFEITPEPKGRVVQRKGKALSFVIQKHLRATCTTTFVWS